MMSPFGETSKAALHASSMQNQKSFSATNFSTNQIHFMAFLQTVVHPTIFVPHLLWSAHQQLSSISTDRPSVLRCFLSQLFHTSRSYYQKILRHFYMIVHLLPNGVIDLKKQRQTLKLIQKQNLCTAAQLTCLTNCFQLMTKPVP